MPRALNLFARVSILIQLIDYGHTKDLEKQVHSEQGFFKLKIQYDEYGEALERIKYNLVDEIVD